MHNVFGGGLAAWLAACLVGVQAAEPAKPQVDLRFESSRMLPPGSVFRRPSLATMIGPDGRIHGVDANTPRFQRKADAGGMSLVGYLSESGATNLLSHSSFEASGKALASSWSSLGKLKVTSRAGGIHGKACLELSGEGQWLHSPIKLPSYSAPDFRGHFLTLYVRLPDGKPPGDGTVRVFAARKRGEKNEIPLRVRFQDPVRVGPWWRIGGHVTPQFENQEWSCGVQVNGTVLVDAIQLERRPLNGCEAPSSYIPTTTGPAGRASELLTLAPETLKWPKKEGTLVVWLRTGSPVHNGSTIVLRQDYKLGDQSQSLTIMHNGGGLDVFGPIGGNRTPRLVRPDHWTQAVLTWKDGRGWTFIDGVQNDRGGPGGYQVRPDFGAPANRLAVGAQLLNYAHLAGYVARVQLFDAAWDHDTVWDRYETDVAAAGGDVMALVKPARPKPPTSRPMIPRKFWVKTVVDLSTTAPTSAVVYDSTGRLVRTLWEAKPMKAGKAEITWDTGNDAGKRVSPGRYQLRMLQAPGVNARYVATPGNGRVPQRPAPHEVAGVHGLTPRGVSVDRRGDVYLLGRGHGVGVQKYSATGQLLWTHIPLDSSDAPTACAIDGETLFVAGQHLYRIDARTGQTIRRPDGGWRAFLGENPSAVVPDRPRAELAGVREAMIDGTVLGGTMTRGVAVRGDEVFVSCWAQDQVRVLHRVSLEQLSTLPLPRPAGLAVDGSGRLLAISGRDLVVRVGMAWRVLIPRVARRPFALAVAADGHLLVSDMGEPCRVLEYTPAGRLVRSYGQPGELPGKIRTDRLYAPTGVAAATDGSVYVSEFLLNRLLKLDRSHAVAWALYGGAYIENASLLSDDPTVVHAMDGYGIGALYEYKLDLDTGRWSPRKWWWLGHSHPTREVRGFMIHGQQTHTLGGHRYLFSCHKTIRIYRFDGDRLVPVARVGSRLRFYDGKGKLARSKTAFPVWVDRNGDGLATEEEVEEVPLGEVGKGRRFPIEPHIGFSHDAEVDRRGTVYWGNFALPLEKIDQRGVPHYTWKTASVVGPDFKPLANKMLEGVAADEQGRRYFDMFYKDDSLRQPGIGHWPRRVIRCDVSCYDKTGRKIWSVGHKAKGLPEPGGIHQPSCIRYEGDWVFVGDEAGMVHIWSRDGLYVASLLNNIYVGNRRGQARQRGYLLPMEVTIGEFWSLDVVRQPRTGRYFLAGQSHEFGEHVRVYEIRGLGDVKRVRADVTVK